MSRTSPTFERFEAWQLGVDLTVAVYELTKKMPDSERYGMVSQLRRSSLSIPTNIAEGCARKGPAEFRRFLNYSIGSISEVSSLLIVSRRLKMIDEEQFNECEKLRTQASKSLWALYKSLKP